MSTTVPAKLLTSILPTTGNPPPARGIEGNNTIKLLPSSDTVIEKSVPLTETFAVGVVTLTFSRLFFAINPEAYLIVPNAAFTDILPVLLEGSYMNSSIFNLEYSVICIRVLSSNVIPTRALRVSIVSFISTPTSICPSIFSSERTI